jgi:putative nucleotidyltransferase with HDIG domain
VPVAAGVAAAVVVTRALPRPTTLGGLVILWLVGFGVSSVVLFGVTREARRFLPLAALLELSLTFPDHTPSRLGVALRSGNLRSPARHQAALRATTGDRAEAIEAVLALAAALSAHDRATRGHSERVRALSELLCEELRLPAEDRVRLRWASLLHDVGKMAVPADLLNKTGPLDDDDWDTLRRHPAEGAKLTVSLAPFLGGWSAAIEQHHERWDGGGYPQGLAGTDVHLGARIVAVADAYEVMTATRAYKKPISGAEARQRLAADAGRQFDPDVVRAFLNISLGRLRFAAGPVAWLAQTPFLRPVGVLARGPAPMALGGALAAAVLALTLPAIDPVRVPASAETAAPRPRVGLEISRATPSLALSPSAGAPAPVPDPVVAAAVFTAPSSSPGPPTAPGAPPPLATVGPPASEPAPAPPSPGVPVEPAPAPEPQPQPAPTALVLVSVRVGDPVDAGVVVGAGDPSTLPVAVPPVQATIQIGS